MKVYIVSRTPSIRKAFGSFEHDCPFTIFHRSLEAAKGVRDNIHKRYGIMYNVYEVDANIARKVN